MESPLNLSEEELKAAAEEAAKDIAVVASNANMTVRGWSSWTAPDSTASTEEEYSQNVSWFATADRKFASKSLPTGIL